MLKTKQILGMVSLTSLLLFGLQSYTTAQWQDEEGVPAGLIEQAISENASSEVEPDKTTIQTVREAGQQVPLYLIEFKSANLCGATGCLHVGYIPAGQNYQRVLGVYLTESNITVSNRVQNGLPCLNFPVPPDAVATWCYDGSKYALSR
ncbi:hypothetical protein [Microcoleus sp. FACHB-68]|uniref:hypothetical protein n=1 Tax=Microcoleus sp. FACHB-68 TaxID=2692826 RepID=UPI0016858941|nr:hypothetical protein [Microcoleus sp. FACHB-68]MBD1937120.1 hypothetical protein [Microcoleus sp. FACHB-68]